VAFKRAVLKYVYSILRGKDLETGNFSNERRVEQFKLLADAQSRALDLQHWHDFLKCIRQAGFRNGKMISSANNVLFSYILYLIGRTEFQIPEFDLRAVIARWFFMSAVTGRFTGSPESAMEFDLARLRGITKKEDFIAALNNVCEVTLTNDFWSVTLPNDLATSASRGPSLFAYLASLVLLDARALYSTLKIADLLDPATHANRDAVERHHLFPKAYLAKHGFVSTRDTNQIANYAWIEWGDNSLISDEPPSAYVPAINKRFKQMDLDRFYRWHALPANWDKLDYKDFLRQRRELMANVIAEGYATLVAPSPGQAGEKQVLDLATLITKGESDAVEFKSTLRTNLHTGQQDPKMEAAVLKTLAGFLNTAGGTLVIGVSDDGTPVGLLQDNFPNEDKMALHLVNIIKARLGVHAMTNLHVHFEDNDEHRVLMVRSGLASAPVFMKDGEIERFYIRTGPSTTELTASQTQQYIKQRFK
jgi:hypothetical protein